MTDKEQINALKAQVNILREALEQLTEIAKIRPCKDIVGMAIAAKALEATPEQCLAEVKAKAIEDAVECTEYLTGPPCANYGIAEPEMMCESSDLLDYAKQLQEQAK